MSCRHCGEKYKELNKTPGPEDLGSWPRKCTSVSGPCSLLLTPQLQTGRGLAIALWVLPLCPSLPVPAKSLRVFWF